MKVLYLDAFAVALNPTASLAAALVGRLGGDLVLYGPGMSSEADLDGGLRAFAERHGPFDLAILGPNLPVLDTRPNAASEAAAFLARFAAFASDRDTLVSSLSDILASISDLPATTKAIWLLNFDFYAVTTAQIEAINRLGLVVLGPNEQVVEPVDRLPEWAASEKHFARKRDRMSDNFRRFLVENPHRTIPLPHFVADAELCFRALAPRRYAIAVPGVEYVMRDRAISALRGSRLGMAPKTAFQAFRFAGRLGLRPLARFLGLRLYHGAFQQTLMDTRYVFTARGGFGIPVRKFFEIPAAGALLMCVPPNGFDALGFKDGVTHVECEPDQLVDMIADLDRRPEEAQRIADAGRRLVAATHSLSSRADQLRVAVEAMRNGAYTGADWVDGLFTMRKGM
ncbi:MAG: glycosyltransferase family 1 protein [Salinarimonadaceae bacterium]|nr:MAG: glycosyltransferase family 1 protein [Salinarimonadaceae bacterium]